MRGIIIFRKLQLPINFQQNWRLGKRIVLLLVAVVILTCGTPKKQAAPSSSSVAQSYTSWESVDAKLDGYQQTDFDLFIPKINLVVPVSQNIDGDDPEEYLPALINGVAHFLGTAKPDEVGNVFVFGHSSISRLNRTGQAYFQRLPELGVGDEILVRYKGRDYLYTTNEKQVVAYDDLFWLQPTKYKAITLMTCYPIGSTKQRLIVRGKLVE